MSDYDFGERYRWSDKEIVDRVFEVAHRQLGAVDVKRANSAEDKRGTDWWAIVPGRRQISIDAKKRSRDWPDVCLEIVSVVETGEPGWAVDPAKETDYLLELWPHRSLLLSYPQVRAATVAHRAEWERLYTQRDKHNQKKADTSTSNRYHTHNVYVPEIVLLDAMYPQLQEIALIPPKDVWRALPQHCATCGASPTGRFPDGSPLYSCGPHPPVYLMPRAEP